MALTLIEQVRLMVGDVGDTPILTDEDYQFLLDKYDDSVRRAALDAAQAILFQLASYPTRERTGDIEVWNEWANAYRKALELFITNPAYSIPSAIAYAGGISKSDMKANDLDNDNVQKKIYQGISDGERVYNHDNSVDDDARYYYGY